MWLVGKRPLIPPFPPHLCPDHQSTLHTHKNPLHPRPNPSQRNCRAKSVQSDELAALPTSQPSHTPDYSLAWQPHTALRSRQGGAASLSLYISALHHTLPNLCIQRAHAPAYLASILRATCEVQAQAKLRCMVWCMVGGAPQTSVGCSYFLLCAKLGQ